MGARPESAKYGQTSGNPTMFFNGIIDEVRIYNRALSAEEIKAHYEGVQTALTLTKTASPHSIKQGQTTTITLTVKNTGKTEIKDIEVADTIPAYLNYVGGETSKKYASLKPKDSREFQYVIQSKDAGTFNLDPAIATYADEKGNYYTAKSNTAKIEVIPSLITTPIPTIIQTPTLTPIPTLIPTSVPTPIPTSNLPTATVYLYGEKTDVVLGEDILLRLAAVNLITKPTMTVQVIIIPPSGMSVTSTGFVKSGAGLYTSTYTLQPGDGKDIVVSIKANQVGDFEVKGSIVYYFGSDKEKAEYRELKLPIKVRPKIEKTSIPTPPTPHNTPGFTALIAFIILTLLILLKKL
ncbi:MAG: BatD family protein [Methanosarcinales archaeon]